MKDIQVTKDLLYLLFTLNITSYEANMKILRKGGYGGPTTMLTFLLKNTEVKKKTVV